MHASVFGILNIEKRKVQRHLMNLFEPRIKAVKPVSGADTLRQRCSTGLALRFVPSIEATGKGVEI